MSILKQELNEDLIELGKAQDLAVKVLSKTLDMTKLTSEKGEFIDLLNLRKLNLELSNSRDGNINTRE